MQVRNSSIENPIPMNSSVGNKNSGSFHRASEMNPDTINRMKEMTTNFFSELIGTGILVFLGCLAVCKGLGQEGALTGVALAFACAVFVAVQATCHNSGGHVNPVVTILALFFKKLDFPMAAVYILGQFIGGIVGYGFLMAITPFDHLHTNGFEEYGVCSTVPHPNLSIAQAFFAEFFFTFILLFVVCSAWDPRNSHHDSLTLKFGFTVFSLAYSGIPYTGCSMNPARSFAPAIWNQAWKDHWIYWIAPTLASVLCGLIYPTFFCPKMPTIFSSGQKPKDEIEMNAS